MTTDGEQTAIDRLDGEVVEQRYGTFEGFEAVDMGETDVATNHDVAGIESEDDESQ